MNEQPEALRLADALKGQVQVNPRVGENDPDCGYVHELDKLIDEAADELRRLHSVNAELLGALKNTTVNLIAAVSLLKSGGKKAAASDKMFAQMLADYTNSFERGRAAIAKAEEVKP
jgi:hypothetical protein